jgi:2-polyprenyl-3-methyl-5-hydroxy-6-metoxy-1,4-benzoquinol methylase
MFYENIKMGPIHADDINNANCRLCSGTLINRFSLSVLYKYNVRYYECEQCHSLQTEKPYWLDEAYKINLHYIDTGAAQRNLDNLAACYIVCKLFKIKNVIDIGGGDGLLCRLLRDYEINCFVKDKFAKPTYAEGFTEPDFKTPELVIAFEVLEHFSYPKTDLDDLFRYNSGVIMVSTLLYANQEQDWWYYAPEGGQHVFFYSKQALDYITIKYNYRLFICGTRIIFVKQELLTPIKSFLLRFLLKGKICRLLKSVIVYLPTPGYWKDQVLIKSKD